MFFISIIGPNTINASSEPLVNILMKEAAIKASADEHTDNQKAKDIIVKVDTIDSFPTLAKKLWEMKDCAVAAKKAPSIRYLPISISSSQASSIVLRIVSGRVGG